MNYKETVDYLFACTPVFEKVGASAYKEGLSNTYALDEHFGHPHRLFRTVHVAGTNGKGSCSHSIASVLQQEGYKVGLYTSPHLVDFRERIRVNGEKISESYVVDFVEKERAFFEPLLPSFFELTTAMAFKYFADSGVDIAVVETGLGGRLDCTNIVSPVVSVITNISFDHTQFLGNTLAQIAGEKAGIIKEKVPVVIGEVSDDTRSVFVNKASSEGAPIIFAEEDEPEVVGYSLRKDGGIDYTTRSFGNIHGDLGGIYQAKNTNTVLCVVKELMRMGIVKRKQSVAVGLSEVCMSTGLLGRWQKLISKPAVVCDTGHNVGGWEYVSRQLAMQECRRMHIVFGMVDDKDMEHVMDMLPKDAIYYFTKASTKRAISEHCVKDCGVAHGLLGDSYECVGKAYKAALANAGDDDFIFVGGSSYIVADLLAYAD